MDPAVGIVLHKKLGSSVKPGESLATIHYNDAARAGLARTLLMNSFGITESPSGSDSPLIRRVLGMSGGTH